MFRRKAAIAVAAAIVAVSSGAAGATARTSSVPWWQSTVFALGPNDAYVAEWMGSSAGWVEIGGPAGNLYVGSAGVFATDPTTGDIAQWNGTTGSSGWTVIGGPGQTFVQSDGHLFGLGPGGAYVAEWNGLEQGWTIIYGQTSAIGGGGAGVVVADSDGQGVSRYNGTPGSWTRIDDQSIVAQTQFAVGDTNIWMVDNTGNVQQWTGVDEYWNLIGRYDRTIYASGANLYAATAVTNFLYEYNGTPLSWSGMDGVLGSQRAFSRTSIFQLATDQSSVGIYTSGYGFTTIGGAAAAIAADEDNE